MIADVGVVAIGRNEGDRLRDCLNSVIGKNVTVVYVDSGSTDGSVEFARGIGAQVVELNLATPFTAARARNTGLERLLEIAPQVRYVQFIDGDCEVVEGWLEQAYGVLESRPEVAVVCGRRRERFPEKSVYNRLADLEWNTPIGEANACGGDAMMRVAPILEVGGYDSTLIAGEEPDLCTRLRALDWKILRIDAEMTRHDIALTRFSQWWRRAMRSGYGGLDVTRRHGPHSHFARQVRSTRRWTLGWLLASLIAICAAWFLMGPVAGLAVLAAAILAPILQAARIGWKNRRRAGSISTGLAYGGLLMVGKWAELAGQFNCIKNRLLGRNAKLIEYKTAQPGNRATHS